MTANGWFQIGLYLLILFLITKPIGIFLARVFERQKDVSRSGVASDRALHLPALRRGRNREMRWTEYGTTMLFFSAVSMILLYVFERLQQWLPFNPQHFANVAPDLAFNTAASFTTNTNWQSYSPESTMSYFTQMAGLGLSQLCFGGGGHRVGDRGDSRHSAARVRNHWKLLGGLDALLSVGVAAGVPGRVAGVCFARNGAEPEAVRHGATG